MWRWVYAIRARLSALLRPGHSHDDLNDELSFHVAMQTKDNVARGMNSAEAERRARLALEGVQQLKERLHEQRSIPWFDHLRQDVTFAVRMIFRTKVVSLAVIVTFDLRATVPLFTGFVIATVGAMLSPVCVNPMRLTEPAPRAR